MNLDGTAFMDVPQLVSSGPEQDFTLFGGGNLASGGATDMFPSLASPNAWNQFDATAASTTSAFAPAFPTTTASPLANATSHGDYNPHADAQQQHQQQQQQAPPQLLVSNSTIAELFPELHTQ
jgi:hypothetical protein